MEQSASPDSQIQQQEANIQSNYIKVANEGMIDFKAQMRREKNLAEVKVVPKNVSAMNAFNLLQDLRHLIILDFRSEEDFNKNHIRKALRVDLTDYKEKIAGSIVSLHEKTKPGNTLPEQEKLDINDEAKKAARQLHAL